MPSALEFLKLQIFAVSVFRPCTGLRGQVAMQIEIIALRHQLTCFNELTNRGAFCSIGGIVVFGCGCHGCGRVGVPLSSSSSLNPSSAGIIKDSDGIGLGRFVSSAPQY